MLSMVRAQLYRTAKSSQLLVFTIVVALVACVIPTMCLAAPLMSEVVDFRSALSGMTLVQIFGNTFLSGSFLGMIAAGFAATVMSADFKTGFAKNLVQARGGRVSFAVAHAVVAVAATVWFMAVGLAVEAALLALVGQPFLPSGAGDMLLVLAQAVVVIAAYCALSQLVVAVTKSEPLGIVVGIFLGGGAVEGALNLVASNVPGLPLAVRTFFDGYLSADLSQLAAGAVTGTGSFLEGGATFAVAVVIAAVVLRRRSLG